MIVSLTGMIDSVSGDSCVIEVHGVGYQVLMALSSLEELSRREQETVKIYTHHHVREDDVSLFGFLTFEDKSVFEKIITVSGVGPKTALTILGVLSGPGFQDAIMNEDHRALTGVSGVGLKTAQRLILELKGKIARNYTGPTTTGSMSGRHSIVSDAVDALGALGYSSKEAVTAVEEIYRTDNSLTTPELVRRALRNLGRK